MELEVFEVLKQYTVLLTDGVNGHKVKAKIVRLAGENDGFCSYETSLYFKANHHSSAYTPGAGGTNVEDAEHKLLQYLKQFQYALLNGGDVVPNAYYIG